VFKNRLRAGLLSNTHAIRRPCYSSVDCQCTPAHESDNEILQLFCYFVYIPNNTTCYLTKILFLAQLAELIVKLVKNCPALYVCLCVNQCGTNHIYL